MRKILLSVIVPMYNVERYIEQCLSSFIIEEVMDYIEVLVINDGSVDSSYDIARSWEERYPEVYRIIKKENGGHGSTINRGIEEAQGKYLKVVDGDDWVNQEGFASLVKALDKSDADLVFTNYKWFDNRSGIIKKEVKSLCSNIEYGREYPADEVLNRSFLKMHAMTFRSEILKQMPERLDEHCFYVDMEYVIFPLPFVENVIFINTDVYMYRIGLTTQSMNIKNMQKRCSQHEKVLNRLLSYYDNLGECGCKKAIEILLGRMLCSQYKIYLSFGHSYKGKLLSYETRIRKDYPEVYSAVSNKAIWVLRYTHYILYDIAALMLRQY